MRVKNDLNRVGDRIVPNGMKTTDRKINAMDNRMLSTDPDPLKGAGQLENRAEMVNGVEEATVIVNNKDAIVGIDVDNTGKKAIIEKQVYAALKGQYPAYNIHVTSDQNMHQKIKSMNVNLTNGHPIKTLANDVSTMIRDISNAVTAPLR
nr:YhcN/YlaJ family sporulation lipoprotein [Paenibacillus sp. PL91]